MICCTGNSVQKLKGSCRFSAETMKERGLPVSDVLEFYFLREIEGLMRHFTREIRELLQRQMHFKSDSVLAFPS